MNQGVEATTRKEQSVRDKLRARLLGAKRGSRIVVLDDGLEVEVRQPSIGATLDMGDKEKSRERMLQLVISHCYVPGTNDLVFEDTDLEVLGNSPLNADYSKLVEALTNLMDVKKATEAAGKQ